MRFVMHLLGRLAMAALLAAMALMLLLPVAGIGFVVFKLSDSPPVAGPLEVAPGFYVHSGTVVALVGSLLAFGMLCFVLILIVVAARALGSAFGSREGAFDGGRLQSDEVEAIQKLHRGFSRLEERVEALETVLLERASQAEFSRNHTGRGNRTEE